MKNPAVLQVCDGPPVEVNPVESLADVPVRDLIRTIIGDEVDKLGGVGVEQLLTSGYEALTDRRIGPASKKKLLAAIEIGRRCVMMESVERDPVRDPVGIARRLVTKYNGYASERLGATYLNSKTVPVLEREVFVGTVNACTVAPREIIRDSLKVNATSVIVWHNHPSGDPGPSADDLLWTSKLQEALRLFDIELLDHLILGNNRFVSLKQRGVIA